MTHIIISLKRVWDQVCNLDNQIFCISSCTRPCTFCLKSSGWYQDNYPPDNYPPDNYPRTNTPRTITPLGQIPPGHLPPLRNFSRTYLGILCTYILHILFFLEEPNIHFMFHIINPFVYCK